MILYRGPSLLDGKPIVVIATGYANKSTNRKTGAMLQTWILCADVDPRDAVRNDGDVSICGGGEHSCPHRGNADGTMRGRSCYVNIGQAPLGVWRTFRRGAYPTALNDDARASLGRGRVVRLGSYGDPAAVPRSVWTSLTRHAESHVGYTHQWRQGFALADLCMASCDSDTDVVDAAALGYRAFHVTPTPRQRTAGFMVCPASAEAGHRLTCSECKSCGGTSSRARAHVLIAAHGPAAGLVRLRKSNTARNLDAA